LAFFSLSFSAFSDAAALSIAALYTLVLASFCFSLATFSCAFLANARAPFLFASLAAFSFSFASARLPPFFTTFFTTFFTILGRLAFFSLSFSAFSDAAALSIAPLYFVVLASFFLILAFFSLMSFAYFIAFSTLDGFQATVLGQPNGAF